MSKVEICNMALGHLGSGKEIADLENERSQEASACRLFYEPARKICLKEFWWPRTSRTIALALIEERPNEEWSYSYRYPSDSLVIRRILSGSRIDSEQSRIKFKIAGDGDGQIVYSDKMDAEAEYTYDEEDADKLPDDFKLAMSFLLAALIAPRLAGGERSAMAKECFQYYRFFASQAAAVAQNEEVSDSPVDADTIRARDM